MNEPAQFLAITMKFGELYEMLAERNRPEFGFIVDPNVNAGVIHINQSHAAVVHPDDKDQMVRTIRQAGWTPIDQT